MSNNKQIPFRAVRGTDEAIQRYGGEEGYLYFATDTRKTYLEVEDSKKILMGQDVEVFYGTKDLPKDNSGKPLNPEVFFHLVEVEGDRLPLVNDLILNKDGCFYRVDKVLDAYNVRTQRLTLQGTGSGGGGGGGGGGSSNFSISFSNPVGNYAFSSESEEMSVGVVGNRENPGDNYLSRIAFFMGDVDIETTDVEPFHQEVGPLEFNIMHPINLAPYKNLFNANNTTVTVAIYDKYGDVRDATIKVRLITIALTERESTLIPATTNTLQFKCNLIGGTSGVSNKKLTYTFYKEEDLEKSVLSLEYNLNTNDTDVITKNLDISSLYHGIYVLKVQASATITGTTDIVASNVLTHKVGYFTETSSPLLMVLAPSKTEQYTNIPIEYLYVCNETNKNYTLEIRINNIFYKNINITSNIASTYSFYFEEAETKRIQFTVLETGVSSTVELILTAYTGQLPIIDLTRDDLMLYLNPKGKTNNDADRNFWADSKAGLYQAELLNVNYSQMDGWLVDQATGDSYLRLISGATLEMKGTGNFRPFASDLVTGKSNVSGLTIELDFEVDGILDYTKPIISCISRDADKIPAVGFEVVGDKVKFYNNRLNGISTDEKVKSALTNQTIVEGKRVKISMVVEPNNGTVDFPMCYTYLNGKLTEAVIFAENDRFIDNYYPATLAVDSTYAQVKIYGIRFYSSALSEKIILNNYTAQLPTLEERQKEYDSNNVYVGNNIDFDLVSAEDYNLEIPYMKLTGGYLCSSSDKWTIDANPNTGLPTGKKNYRLVDVEVVYPKTPFFNGYENYSYKNEFENGLGMADNAGNKPSNGGAIMYCQGTSSMEYPIKNLRLRWKKEKNFFKVKPNLAPVEIICMKADYMESSGSHNTGAANLIDDIYEGVNMCTPGQEQFQTDTERIVTCIKGHPCLIFYSETGEPGTYQYIGKYNLNLDKATPEPFGFNHDEETGFGYLKDETGALVLDDEGNKQNSIFCYEFLDNSAFPVCNFLVTTLADKDGKVPTSYEETWYNTFWHQKDQKYYPGWRMGFESRYPEDDESTHGADAFYPLANWVNELYSLRVGIGQFEGAANEQEALNRFKNEYWKFMDKDYLLAYYIITEALLMADSRVKNMMIATWGKEWRFLMKDGSIQKIGADGKKPSANDIQESYFGYIFYPIFYDMDTMLGVSNEGRLKFNYYTEDTESEIYNGANVLWHLLRDSMPNDLAIKFNELEGGKLHAPLMLPYFNDNQANMANEAFYNGDAAYKYINPAREGYQDLLNNEYIAPGAAPYLYALQGDRSLHRESFINNRMQYLRGKYSSSKFLTGDQVAFRWYTPKSNDTNPLVAQSAVDVPADGVFTFTGLKTGFAGVQLGKNGVVYTAKFGPGTQETIELQESSTASATEAYLLGVSVLSDLGDLSNKYMGKFVISSLNNRLKRVQLGNPHKNYYNVNWASGTEQIIIDSPTLEEFNLQNCGTYNRIIDFRNNPVITTVLMTGSGATDVLFPENGVLTELRLPNTIPTFKIVGHKNLTNENFSMGTYEYGPDNLIGGEGGRYVNDFSRIQYLEVIDTPIDTYAIADGAKNLLSYNLHGINWTITEEKDQYCKRTSDWTYIDENGETKTLKDKVPAGYYYLSNGQYIPYESDTFPTDDDYLHEKVSMTEMRGEDRFITCIPLLERLLTLNTTNEAPPHNEALSGTITINVPNTSVVELEIYDKYRSIYPNVVIKYGDNVNVEEASTVNFYPGTADNEYVESVGGVEGLTPAHFSLTAKNAHTLQELIGDYKPVKVQTIANTFEFTGQWVDWADPAKTVYYQFVEGHPIPSGKEAFSFANFKPEKDMDLVPVFQTHVRKYVITLYDYDGKTVLAQESIDYQADIGATMVSTHAIYNYREHSDPNLRWAFKGWQTKFDYQSQSPAPSFSYLEGQKVTSDVGYYAFYKEEDVYTTPSMISKLDDFFDFSENHIVQVFNGEESTTGVQISLKDKYRYLLQGKITLPILSPSGKKIISIGNFSDTNKSSSNPTNGHTKFTHIYIQDKENSHYLEIGGSAFAWANTSDGVYPALEEVYLPSSIVSIGVAAFNQCANLKFVELSDNVRKIESSAFWGLNNSLTSIGLDELPTKLEYIGPAAFWNAGPGIKATKLPDKVVELPDFCLSDCVNVNISVFGSTTNPMTKIAFKCLDNSGSNTIHSMKVFCLDNAAVEEAFYGYNVNVSDLEIYSPSANQDYNSWALNLTQDAKITQTVL